MAAQVTLIPGTSILEYRFEHDLNLEQYRDCYLQGSQLVDQIPYGPVYALVDVRNLRTVPFNFLQETRKMPLRRYRAEGVAVIGANAFYRMLARMTIQVFRRREIALFFCETREEAIAALNRLARHEWIEEAADPCLENTGR
jgi:hypothetical protein